jgi:AmmeMemoRadiSam system protein B
MNDPLLFPKLRWPISLSIEEFEGQQVLLVNCPLGVSTPLGLVPAVAPLISRFDGSISIYELANQFADNGATVEIIQQLIDLLDQNHYLETPRFTEAHRALQQEFRSAPSRRASRAGYVYEASPEALERQLNDFLKLGDEITPRLQGGMMGLMAPHIDYRRGGHSYGKTYRQMEDERHDLYVLIGTSHQYSSLLFHLTEKHFECPLEDARCNREFVKQLSRHYGEERSFRDELLHRDEHSLELQIPFLMRVSSGAQIAPILVGSFHHMLSSEKYPEEFPEYDEFSAALAESIKDIQQNNVRICFLAGVDMAHVGQSFGDPDPLTPKLLEQVAARDQEYIACIQDQNKHRLFEHIAEDQDARRICGFPTMYTVIDVCDRLGLRYEAELFDYSQAVDYETDCAVTFAGMGLYSALPQSPVR